MDWLVTGKGSSGSWLIRGSQLGAAIGATVQPNATDIAGYKLAVVVKRCPSDLLARLHAAKIPLIFDVLDSWPQPAGNDWPREKCLDWLRPNIKRMKPAGIVAATQAMAEDCAEFGVPVLALPHHAWPGKPINVISPKVRSVGYQGGAPHLGKWQWFLNAECARRGWTFHVNPLALADVDIAVAVREATGYAVMNWKSNCKLANAQGSGTPIVCTRESGYVETASGAERWVRSQIDVVEAFDYLTDQGNRVAASAAMLAVAPRLEDIAARYREWLANVQLTGNAGTSGLSG